TTFSPYVAGIQVEFTRSGSVIGRFHVVSVSGNTLTLDQSVQGVVASGDMYQGVLKLDSFAVRRGANAVTSDIVDALGFAATGDPAALSPIHTSFRAEQIRVGSFTAGGFFSLSAPVRASTGHLVSPATLTHEPATLTSFSSLDLGFTDTFTIDAGASIDVS